MRASFLDHCGSHLTPPSRPLPPQDSQTVVSLQRIWGGGGGRSSAQGHVPETLEGLRRGLCYSILRVGPEVL